MKINFNVITLNVCSIIWQLFLISDLVKSNICIAKIYWTKSNIPLKCDFKSDEDNNKHSLAPCEVIFKLRHTLLALIPNKDKCAILVYYIEWMWILIEIFIVHSGSRSLFGQRIALDIMEVSWFTSIFRYYYKAFRHVETLYQAGLLLVDGR